MNRTLARPGGESTWFSGVPREPSRTGDAEGHTDELVEQLRKIVEEGMPARKFTLVERSGTARAVHGATARFHGPAHAPQWQKPDGEGEFAAVADLLLRGLAAGPGGTGPA
ncbi:hypothetical protein [Streptomyces sp. NPDC058572]|uniref:hypothetical protein n=1 Tax=Streptomyces sp. NPDC058572 TaxID=3346546 RepID=UPI0036603B3F